ncbi:protease SohB [Buchnera aphidicola (Thelaxes californica)]|uniref:Protease SohB n=1 Tax=Buchnera aphidicola (Thelaxes californica) TaxID=1315998 RepID=A0A4D6YCD3_9GAMM|nr:protease SohB [Buchnera aphidicola]QCI26752.1 protease SohB [Buchnera aphidicola (Thelaxes californica)]
MHLIYNYVFFLIKILTVFFILICLFKCQKKEKINSGKMIITSLSDDFNNIKKEIKSLQKKNKKKMFLTSENFIAFVKRKIKQIIHYFYNSKLHIEFQKPVLYVLDFKGGIHAEEVTSLRNEISAIISVAQHHDEVLLRLESPGGTVNGYGLAAAQLQRLRNAHIKLIISVDKIATSGGYMMACVANHITASSFSIIGSIGVCAQLPNFYKFLKKNNIDVESHFSGEYKRTLTMFGENTPKGREKFCQILQDTHDLFKQFILNMRPQLKIEDISSGEHWFGTQALKKKFIDSINTSDDIIQIKMKNFHVLQIQYVIQKKMFFERISNIILCIFHDFYQFFLKFFLKV